MTASAKRADERAADRILTRAVAKAVVMVRAGEDPRQMLGDAERTAELLLEGAA